MKTETGGARRVIAETALFMKTLMEMENGGGGETGAGATGGVRGVPYRNIPMMFLGSGC